MGIDSVDRLIHGGIVFAQKGRIHNISTGFSGAKTRVDFYDVLWLVLGLVAAIALLAVISRLSQIHARRQGYYSPVRLFLSLCRAHRLRWSQGILLWRVARTQRLHDLARLFLEPERLEAAGRTKAFRTRNAELSTLRDQIFGRQAIHVRG